MTCILDVQNISYATSAGQTLISHSSLQGYSQDIICLLGNNGSGKSTFLKLCAGILTPTGGIIQRAPTAWLPQYLNRPDHFSASQFLNLRSIPTEPQPRLRRDASFQECPFFSINNIQDKEVAQLSGGEWKILQLVRLYQDAPDVILLDEPESDLDLSHVQSLIKYCKYLAQKGACLVVTTHNMSFAKAIASRVCGMEKGQIVWNSPAAQFWGSHAFFKLFGCNEVF